MSATAPAGTERTEPTPAEPSLAYLFARLGIVEARVRAAVDRRRADDPDPNDRFRGLYISDAQVDGLLSAAPGPWVPEPVAVETSRSLAGLEDEADAAEAAGADLRLRRLARAFGLDDYDVELLLIALAPDLDPRFERLYGYLHDDVSRRRASAGLALELCGTGSSPGASRGRVRLGPLGPLVAGGLLIVEDADRPFLTRSLRVPDRVAAHLLGDDTADAADRSRCSSIRSRPRSATSRCWRGRSTRTSRSSTSASGRARPATRSPGPPSPASGGPPSSSTSAGWGRTTIRARSPLQPLARPGCAERA